MICQFVKNIVLVFHYINGHIGVVNFEKKKKKLKENIVKKEKKKRRRSPARTKFQAANPLVLLQFFNDCPFLGSIPKVLRVKSLGVNMV